MAVQQQQVNGVPGGVIVSAGGLPRHSPAAPPFDPSPPLHTVLTRHARSIMHSSLPEGELICWSPIKAPNQIRTAPAVQCSAHPRPARLICCMFESVSCRAGASTPTPSPRLSWRCCRPGTRASNRSVSSSPRNRRQTRSLSSPLSATSSLCAEAASTAWLGAWRG